MRHHVSNVTFVAGTVPKLLQATSWHVEIKETGRASKYRGA
ncbi:hypothetical protein ACP70R_031648 [Stipagrostis hirtigluma subsp. patula]